MAAFLVQNFKLIMLFLLIGSAIILSYSREPARQMLSNARPLS